MRPEGIGLELDDYGSLQYRNDTGKPIKLYYLGKDNGNVTHDYMFADQRLYVSPYSELWDWISENVPYEVWGPRYDAVHASMRLVVNLGRELDREDA